MCRGHVVAAGMKLGVVFDLVFGLALAVAFCLGRRSCAGLDLGDYLGFRNCLAASGRGFVRL